MNEMKKYDLNQPLSEEEIEEYIKLKTEKNQKINWCKILKFQNLSENFLEKYHTYKEFDWNQLSKHQNISENFLEKHINELDCDIIRKRIKLSPEIIEKYPQKLDEKIIMKELIRRGWTKTIIKKFYPNHEEHWYRKDRVYYLYCLSFVNKIENSDEFKKAMQKTILRREGINKKKQDKLAKDLEFIENMKIFVPEKPISVLKKNAIRAWENWNKLKESEGRYVESTIWENPIDSEETKRITCNYIRHELTNYEKILNEFLTDYDFTLYSLIHSRYLNAIYEKYPELKPVKAEMVVE